MRRLGGCAPLVVVACLIHGLHASAQQSSPVQLTLQDAITLALKSNLGVLVAGTQISEAEGSRQRQLAALLPHVSGDSMANLQNRSLAAFRISVPGIPAVVGPFAYYDFRVAASQRQEQSARLDYQDTRDLVIRETAGFYLNAESGLAEVQAAESRVATSEALEKLARDQHNQGLATGVDVVRAQVQLARDKQNLLVAQDNYQTALLTLARFLGLEPGTPIELREKLEFKYVKPPDPDQAAPTVLEARSDYRALLSQRDALVEQRKAAHARYLPSLSVSGDYGSLGRTFGSMAGIGEIQGTLSITLFDRDRSGEQRQIESRMERVSAQIHDLSLGIEQDIRKAVLDLQSAEQQVSVTQSALDLAEQELKLARDRFRNGVTDNIEVITAQNALSAAQDDKITALARHADARAALVRALGATEQNYKKYLSESVEQGSKDTSGDR